MMITTSLHAHRNRVKKRQTVSAKQPTPHGLRLAAIDIGTNSLHMVTVEVTDQLSFRILSSDKDLTQLGENALLKHELSRRAMDQTCEALARYQRIAKGLDCDVILAYATSAMREATNGGDFAEEIRRRLGLKVQVISSEEEARLIYLAVNQAVDLSSDGHPALIVDIGGGSCELIVGNDTHPLLLQSRKLGAARLMQQFIQSDPISKGDLKKLRDHITRTLMPLIQQITRLGVHRVIGTSGTMENTAAMCLEQHGQEVQRNRLLTDMRHDDFEEIYQHVRDLPLEKRRDVPGLDPGRAPQIVAGMTLIDYLFKTMKLEQIEVCDRAMREGMIIDYMMTHWPKIKLSVQVRDPRRRSVIELGQRCNFDEPHAIHVAKLSLEIFDQTRRLHKLGSQERELMEYAALMHDVGWHIGHSGHHKHSWYLIRNGDLDGFSPSEIDIMANVARYHRKSMPQKTHEAYMMLDSNERKTVDILAGILRIADGLDRGHYANIRSVHSLLRKDGITFVASVHGDPELELWSARSKTDLFEKAFKRTVRLIARPENEEKPHRRQTQKRKKKRSQNQP